VPLPDEDRRLDEPVPHCCHHADSASSAKNLAWTLTPHRYRQRPFDWRSARRTGSFDSCWGHFSNRRIAAGLGTTVTARRRSRSKKPECVRDWKRTLALSANYAAVPKQEEDYGAKQKCDSTQSELPPPSRAGAIR